MPYLTWKVVKGRVQEFITNKSHFGGFYKLAKNQTCISFTVIECDMPALSALFLCEYGIFFTHTHPTFVKDSSLPFRSIFKNVLSTLGYVGYSHIPDACRAVTSLSIHGESSSITYSSCSLLKYFCF